MPMNEVAEIAEGGAATKPAVPCGTRRERWNETKRAARRRRSIQWAVKSPEEKEEAYKIALELWEASGKSAGVTAALFHVRRLKFT